MRNKLLQREQGAEEQRGRGAEEQRDENAPPLLCPSALRPLLIAHHPGKTNTIHVSGGPIATTIAL
jgi:hypothetical protein